MPNPEHDHLSVNALELESRDQIAQYYTDVFGSEEEKVAVCIHRVLEYNDSGKKAGCWVEWNRANSTWEFPETNGTRGMAYRHRPVKRTENFPHVSWSHCGVEFVRALADLKLRQFARRMAKRKIIFLTAETSLDG
jgi:hypothetical protein